MALPEPMMTGDSEFSIKVGNLPPNSNPQDICDAFAEQGIDTMTDCYIPQGRGFGFVRFSSSYEGKLALQRRPILRGMALTLEPAVGTKRSSGEMAAINSPMAKLPRHMPQQGWPQQGWPQQGWPQQQGWQQQQGWPTNAAPMLPLPPAAPEEASVKVS